MSENVALWVATTATGLVSALCAALYRANAASNARVEQAVGEQGKSLAALATEVTVLRTHLFGATGDNGMNSRLHKLEDRADGTEQWQHDHKSLHQASELRLTRVEDRQAEDRRQRDRRADDRRGT